MIPGTESIKRISGSIAANLERVADGICDIGGLLLDDRKHGAGGVVEPECGIVVPGVGDDAPRDPVQVNIGVGADLAADDNQPGCDERLARDSSVNISRKHRIENCVRNPIS